MTEYDFEKQMMRLKATYGKDIDNERKLIVWNAVSHVDHRSFETFVTSLISTERNYPMPDKFREWAFKFNRADSLDEIRLQLGERRGRCERCAGSGVVEIRKPSDGFRYAVLRTCTCDAGDLARRLPENRTMRRLDADSDWLEAGKADEVVTEGGQNVVQRLSEVEPEKRADAAWEIVRRVMQKNVV